MKANDLRAPGLVSMAVICFALALSVQDRTIAGETTLPSVSAEDRALIDKTLEKKIPAGFRREDALVVLTELYKKADLSIATSRMARELEYVTVEKDEASVREIIDAAAASFGCSVKTAVLPDRKILVAFWNKPDAAEAAEYLKKSKSKDAAIRLEAAAGLARLGDRGSLEALAGMASDADAAVSYWAFEGLLNSQAFVPMLPTDSRSRLSEMLTKRMADADDTEKQRLLPLAAALGLIDILEKAIDDPDASVRRDAASSFFWFHDPRAAALLIHALEDKDLEVRKAAANVLRWMRDRRAVEPLAKMLADALPEIRHAAATALAEIDDPRGFDQLLAEFKGTDSKMRQNAIIELSRSGDPRGISAAITAFKDPDLGGWAALFLRDCRNPAAFDPLRAALKDPDAGVRRDAASCLGRIGGPKAVDILLAALEDEDLTARGGAFMGLGATRDPHATKRLLEKIKSADFTIRRDAIEALGETRDTAAVNALLKALEDPHMDWDAGRSLCAIPNSPLQAVIDKFVIGDKKSSERSLFGPFPKLRQTLLIISLLENAEAPTHARTWAAGCLKYGKENTSKAVSALLKAMIDPDAKVREKVYESLGILRDPRAIEPLQDVLKDPKKEGYMSAAKALGQIGGPQVDEFLRSLITSEAAMKRGAGALALGARRDKKDLDLLEAACKDPEAPVRAAAIEGMQSNASPRAIDLLLAAFRDPDAKVRATAAGAGALVSNPKALDALVAALKDSDEEVRRNAAGGFRWREDIDKAIDALAGALKDPSKEVRQSAVEALARTRAPAAVGPLIDALKDGEWSIRIHADMALRRYPAEARITKALQEHEKHFGPSFDSRD
jgi:HEAT repeat protein